MSARTIQARLAAESRYRPHSDLTGLRRDHAAAKLEEYVSRVVAAAPPLTDEQRHRIARLLTPAGGGAA